MPYRYEIASTNRAGCKNSACVHKGEKILKGELRFGTLVVTQQFTSWTWKHWHIGNIIDEIGGLEGLDLDSDLDILDGWEDLPDWAQDKIRFALKNGHVEDSDWKGDPELNRPGQKGINKTRRKKKKKDDDDEQDEAAENGSPAETKPKKARAKKKTAGSGDDEDDGEVKPKQKSRSKKKTAADEDNDEPAVPKKSRSKKRDDSVKEEQVDDQPPTAKKTSGRKRKAADDDSEDDGPPTQPAPKTRKPRAKKAKIVSDEDDSATRTPSPAPEPKKRRGSEKAAANTGKKRQASRQVDGPGDVTEDENPVTNSTRGKKETESNPTQRSSRGRKVKSEKDNEQETEANIPKPTKTRGRKAVKVEADEHVEDGADIDHEIETTAPARKSRRSSKKAGAAVKSEPDVAAQPALRTSSRKKEANATDVPETKAKKSRSKAK